MARQARCPEIGHHVRHGVNLLKSDTHRAIERQVLAARVERLELTPQQLFVPLGEFAHAVDRQPKGPNVLLAHVVARDDRHLGEAQLLRRFESEVSVDYLARRLG